MKYLEAHSYHVRIASAVFIMMLFYGCTKTVYDRRSRSTQTPESREYFGFILNGRGFKSEESTGNVSGSCTYKEKFSSGSIFRIQANHSAPECISNSIEIILDSVDIKEGSRFVFGTPGPGKNYLVCNAVTECSNGTATLTSKDNNFGYIKITKFNADLRVITGVFACIVSNDNGLTYIIADGYFDRHFTR
jgi:hypothetical protein